MEVIKLINRFQLFVSGVSTCYKYIQRIKNLKMTEFGLKGTHVMCLFFLHHNPEGLTAAQLCQLCAEDKAAIDNVKSFCASSEEAVKRYQVKEEI